MTWSVSYCLVHLESFRDWVLISPEKYAGSHFHYQWLSHDIYICMRCSAGQPRHKLSLERLPCYLKGASEKGSPSVPLGIMMSEITSKIGAVILPLLSGTSLKRMVEQEDWNSFNIESLIKCCWISSFLWLLDIVPSMSNLRRMLSSFAVKALCCYFKKFPAFLILTVRLWVTYEKVFGPCLIWVKSAVEKLHALLYPSSICPERVPTLESFEFYFN